MEMYSISNERKSVIAEIFIINLKNKIYKCMISISKNVYIGKLDDIVNKYNKTYQRTIKVKPVDVEPSTNVDFSTNIDPKFKIGDIVRISKDNSIFAKVYVPNWSEEFFVIKNVKSTVTWTYISSWHATFRGHPLKIL